MVEISEYFYADDNNLMWLTSGVILASLLHPVLDQMPV